MPSEAVASGVPEEDIAGEGEGDIPEIDNAEGEGEDVEVEGEVICSPCWEDINPTKIIRNPLNPTKAERERHNINHCPYRSWCDICVSGRGKEDPHYRNNKHKGMGEGLPVIGLDYKSAGQEGNYDDKVTIIVGRDKMSKGIIAPYNKAKGEYEDWLVDNIISGIDYFGHN